MTELVLNTGRRALAWAGISIPANAWRLLLMLIIAALAASSPELRQIVFSAISDAYLQVTVFVAATLALVYLFENTFRFDLGRVMAGAKYYQAPIASFLGALPGCGGAIIVVTQYTKGYVSFGSVVAVLIATMGDAAFLLIAREPTTGLMLMATGFTVGTISGWVVDRIHGLDFMRANSEARLAFADRQQPVRPVVQAPAWRLANSIWVYLAVPGAVLGLLVATQYETDGLFGSLAEIEPTHWFGALAGIMCLSMWALSTKEQGLVGQHDHDVAALTTTQRVIKDTNFVTTWVVLGFLTYELAVHFVGSGIENWLHVWAPLVPLVAIIVGFIPGCGPQIVITTLYLTGTIPLSAQFGNAIANDGDALFPALPRTRPARGRCRDALFGDSRFDFGLRLLHTFRIVRSLVCQQSGFSCAKLSLPLAA